MKLLTLLLLPALGALCAAEPAKPAKPNILFILTEDNSTQLSFLGTPGIKTPNIDSIAKAGVYFNNAFVGYPVCSPSKTCIYTGLHNHTNGILNNTPNYHKPADQLTEAEKNNKLYLQNRIQPTTPTLIEILRDAGYYQGVMHKLHVAPVEKFPYDEWIEHSTGAEATAFFQHAAKAGKPWHLFYNIAVSHRPFPDSDKKPIRVKPNELKLPAFLPDTPVVRKDWAEYFAAVEAADVFVGQGLAALKASGQESNTIIVYLGDHGPAFPHGKMTLYDLGLRTPLAIYVPWLKGGMRTDELVSELDLTPTLLDLLGLKPLPKADGISLKPVLEGESDAKGHPYIFAEISDRGNLPNDGMQERSVYDGRYHMIYREKLTPPWRQVQADSQFPKPWGNRSYDETVKFKNKFPVQYRILAEMNPQELHGKVHPIEFYDLKADPDEMRDLVGDASVRPELDRLYGALLEWVKTTADTSLNPPATVSALVSDTAH